MTLQSLKFEPRFAVRATSLRATTPFWDLEALINAGHDQMTAVAMIAARNATDQRRSGIHRTEGSARFCRDAARRRA